jgi:hypothetical protein
MTSIHITIEIVIVNLLWKRFIMPIGNTEDKLKITNFVAGASFEAEKFPEAIDLAIKVEEGYGNSSIRNFCASLNTRLDDTLRRSDFEFLFSSIEFKIKFSDSELEPCDFQLKYFVTFGFEQNSKTSSMSFKLKLVNKSKL